jgi:hypothetical protein
MQDSRFRIQDAEDSEFKIQDAENSRHRRCKIKMQKIQDLGGKIQFFACGSVICTRFPVSARQAEISTEL